jgi:hypothetical protein
MEKIKFPIVIKGFLDNGKEYETTLNNIKDLLVLFNQWQTPGCTMVCVTEVE